MAGRPCKLTPEVQTKIVAAVRAGNYARVAAQCAGIGESTFYRWLEQGEAEEEGPFREFWEAIKAAEAEAEARAVEMVRKHMKDSWQAAMTFLERRHPDRWKRRDELDIRRLSTEQLLEAAAEIDRRIESAGDRVALAESDR